MSVGPADEYKALRAEMAARHKAAIAVFSCTVALPTVVVSFARAERPIECGIACAALLVVIAAGALLTRALFQGLNRIGAYIEVFHEGEQPAAQTAARLFNSASDTLRQPRTMAWCLAAMGFLVLLAGISHCLSGRAAIVSLALIVASGVAQAVATIMLWSCGRKKAYSAAVTEWQRVRASLAAAPPTETTPQARPELPDIAPLPQPTPALPAAGADIAATAAPPHACRRRVFWPWLGAVSTFALVGAACTWLMFDPDGPRTDAVAVLLGAVAGWGLIACLVGVLYRKQANADARREQELLQSAGADDLRRRVSAARGLALGLSDLLAANATSIDRKLEGQEAVDLSRFVVSGFADRFNALGDALQDPQIPFAAPYLEAAFRTLEEVYFRDRSSGLLTPEQWWAQFFQSAMVRRAFALNVSSALSTFGTQLPAEATEAELQQQVAVLRDSLGVATATHARAAGVRGM